jgi:hypothetical protein
VRRSASLLCVSAPARALRTTTQLQHTTHLLVSLHIASMNNKSYICSCEKYCGGQEQTVSRSTFCRHAPFRRKRTFGFKNYLESQAPGPSSGARGSSAQDLSVLDSDLDENAAWPPAVWFSSGLYSACTNLFIFMHRTLHLVAEQVYPNHCTKIKHRMLSKTSLHT